ncbi:hypothetical protein B7494_g8160 [Chlorociboria aeruginascens]|nr:hypothetical protein B7494_g8160 [Chlorociboria aeruginascens]
MELLLLCSHQKKKKSLFNKPGWTKAPTASSGVDFFSRAHELFPTRVAEEERRREKKLNRSERKRSSTSIEKQEHSPRASKRRRSSQTFDQNPHSSDDSDHDRDDDYDDRKRRLSTPGSRKTRSNSTQVKDSPTSLTDRYTQSIRRNKQEDLKLEAPNYITLSDSGSDAGKDIVSTKRQSPRLNDHEADDIYTPILPTAQTAKDDDLQLSEEDDEFAELIQKAKEREKLKAMENSNSGSGIATPTFGLDDFDPLTDPTLEIFISSWIEGTKPVVVKRKLSQRLKEVRRGWCDRQFFDGQPMGEAVRDAIFLTWKGKRLFDETTCKGLGLKLDSKGGLPDSEGFADGKVHIEAWTEELFTIFQAKEAAKKAGRYSERDGTPEVVEEIEVKKIKLVLQSKDHQAFKIVVKPFTLVQKVISAFRQAHEISDDKEISLHFDGDRLDPESKIEETELDDMDTVETHIR